MMSWDWLHYFIPGGGDTGSDVSPKVSACYVHLCIWYCDVMFNCLFTQVLSSAHAVKLGHSPVWMFIDTRHLTHKPCHRLTLLSCLSCKTADLSSNLCKIKLIFNNKWLEFLLIDQNACKCKQRKWWKCYIGDALHYKQQAKSCWFFLALTVTLLQITCELSENVAVASKVFEMQLQQLIGDLFALWM